MLRCLDVLKDAYETLYDNVFVVASEVFSLLIFILLVSLSACAWDASLADELVDREGRVIPCKGMRQIVFESGVCVEGDCLGCSQEGSKRCNDFQFIFKLKSRFCPVEYGICEDSECRVCPKEAVFVMANALILCLILSIAALLHNA